jgi:hypothetical protein
LSNQTITLKFTILAAAHTALGFYCQLIDSRIVPTKLLER